jgi:hypothetical protein
MIPMSSLYASNNGLSRNACRRPPRLGWSALPDISQSARSGELQLVPDFLGHQPLAWGCAVQQE